MLWLLNALIVCVGGATAYLLLFNRPTHQGLQDLATDTFVVRSVPVDSVERRPVWPGHWAILASLFLVFGLGGGLLMHWIGSKGSFSELAYDLAAAEAVPGIRNASVKALRTWQHGTNVPLHWLVIQVVATGKREEDEGLATAVAQAVLARDAKAKGYDAIRVVVIRGFDLGLTSSWRSQVFTHAPAEWD